MDQETREAFNALMGLTTQNGAKTEECIRLLEHHDERMTRLESDVANMKREIFVSNPPPPTSALPGAASPASNGAQPPVHKRVSATETELGNLAGQVQALAGEVTTVKETMATKQEVGEIKTDVTTIKDINVAQNNTYGISKKEAPRWKKVLKFLGSRDGRNFLLTILIVVLSSLGYKTATDTKQATVEVEKQIQRTEENVVRNIPVAMGSASPHGSTAPRPPPASSAAKP